jgi:hypothetical protein
MNPLLNYSSGGRGCACANAAETKNLTDKAEEDRTAEMCKTL